MDTTLLLLTVAAVAGVVGFGIGRVRWRECIRYWSPAERRALEAMADPEYRRQFYRALAQYSPATDIYCDSRNWLLSQAPPAPATARGR